jgi:hypothetical protein
LVTSFLQEYVSSLEMNGPGLCQESGCRIVLKGADKFIKGGLPMDTPRKKSEFGWRPFEGIDQLFSNLPARTETQSAGGSGTEAGWLALSRYLPLSGAGPSAGRGVGHAAAADQPGSGHEPGRRR